MFWKAFHAAATNSSDVAKLDVGAGFGVEVEVGAVVKVGIGVKVGSGVRVKVGGGVVVGSLVGGKHDARDRLNTIHSSVIAYTDFIVFLLINSKIEN